MTHRSSKVELLDKTISALQDLVLSAPDNEILSQSPNGGHVADDMRRLIEGNIANSGLRSPSLVSIPDRLPAKTKRISRTSTNLMNRLALLKSLMATRPELAPRLGAVFSSQNAPTNEELDDLTKELIQMGLLPKDGSETK